MKNNDQEYYLKKIWENFVAKNKLPEFIPKDPEKYYTKTGDWVSWADFFSANVERSLNSQHSKNNSFPSEPAPNRECKNSRTPVVETIRPENEDTL